MGKPTKRQSRKPYNYDKNRRREWKNKKKLPAIKCPEIKAAWDRRKSVRKNLEEMGLCTDPNQTFRIQHTKELIGPVEEVDAAGIKEIRAKTKPKKEYVVKAIEAEASIPPLKTNKLSEPLVMFCTYMLDKYGDDFKAMARDPQNHYQETPKQIKKKMNMFKNNPEQYGAYLRSKVDAVLGSPGPSNMCCSPVGSTELRTETMPVRRSSRAVKRRVTRMYEAARRNGHYSLSPDGEQLEVKMPVSLVRVRRKLQFGRKPPRDRISTS